MQSLRLVFRYVIRQPRRAILTMLTFAVATFIFTVLAAIPSSIDMILQKDRGDAAACIPTTPTGVISACRRAIAGTIEKIPGVVACKPMVVLRATYQSASETVQAFALDADKVALMYPDYNLPPEVIEQFSSHAQRGGRGAAADAQAWLEGGRRGRCCAAIPIGSTSSSRWSARSRRTTIRIFSCSGATTWSKRKSESEFPKKSIRRDSW